MSNNAKIIKVNFGHPHEYDHAIPATDEPKPRPLVPVDYVETQKLVNIYFNRTEFREAAKAAFIDGDVLPLGRMIMAEAAWGERIPGSLPNSDVKLARLVCDGNMHQWRSMKDDLLDGWIVCDNDRLYHPDVAAPIVESVDAYRQKCRAGANGRKSQAKNRGKKQSAESDHQAALAVNDQTGDQTAPAIGNQAAGDQADNQVANAVLSCPVRHKDGYIDRKDMTRLLPDNEKGRHDMPTLGGRDSDPPADGWYNGDDLASDTVQPTPQDLVDDPRMRMVMQKMPADQSKATADRMIESMVQTTTPDDFQLCCVKNSPTKMKLQPVDAERVSVAAQKHQRGLSNTGHDMTPWD